MKCFKKAVATVSALALVVAGLAGYQANVSAAAVVATTPWEFYQTGTSTDGWNAWELCAFSSIETTAGEYFTPSHDSIGTASNNDALTTYTTEPADGFTAVIESDGWSANYEYDEDNNAQINPYCLRASMKNIAITNGHNYTLSFTAKASSDKFAYVECGDYILEIIKITTDDVAYEYTFTAEGDTVDFDLLLGAFVGKYDYSGNDVSDIIGDGETNWSGTVYISDFTLIDEDAVEDESDSSAAVEDEDESSVEDDTTAADGTATDTTVDTATGTTVDTAAATTATASDEVKAPAKASIKSAKKAGKKVTVKAKKVANASGYEVAVYKTKKNAKKNKKAIASATSAKKKVVVSSKKIKKAKKVFVKVRAYTTDASGANVYGAWSKVKKVK